MSKYQFNKPQQPRYITANNYWTTNNELNREVVNELFLYFSEGDYYKISDFILSNNFNTYVLDDDDNNIIHKIIENDFFSDAKKLDLIKLCISKGVDVSTSNKYNITPLHLACSIQSLNIVELLLINGAEINKRDSNGRTPFYYAVVGKNVRCSSSDAKKINSVVKKDNIRTEKILDDLEIKLNAEFGSIPEIKNFLSSMRKIFKEYKNVFPDEFLEFKKNLENIKTQIISDYTKTSKEKKQLLIQKIMSERDKIFSRTKIKLLNSDVIKIRTGQTDGWKPDGSDDSNKILNHFDANLLYGKLENFFNNSHDDNIKKTNEIISQYDEIYDILIQYIEKVRKYSGNIYCYLLNLSSKNEIEKVNDLFLYKDKNIKKGWTDVLIKDEALYDIEKEDVYKNIFDAPEIILTFGKFKKLASSNKILTQQQKNNFYNKIQKSFKNISDDQDISNIFRNIYGHDIYNALKQTYDGDFNEGFKGKNFYFIAVYKYYLSEMGLKIGELINKIAEMQNNMSNDDYDKVINIDIYDIIIIIINISLILSRLDKEIDDIDKHIKNNMNNLRFELEKHDQDKNNKINNFMFYELNENFELYKSVKLPNMKECYNVVNESVKWLENIVGQINEKSALKYLKKNIDNTYDLDKLLNVPIFEKIPFAKSLNKFLEFVSDNVKMTNSNLLKEFVPKLSYCISFYSKGSVDENCSEGYLKIEGKIGKKNMFDEMVFPIIMEKYGEQYVDIIKYNIMQKTLQYVYDKTQNTSEINKLIKEFEISFGTKDGDHSAILVILGNAMKNVLDNFIKELILSSINRMVLQLTEERENPPEFYIDLQTNLLLARIKNAYELKLNDMYSIVSEKFGSIIQGNLVEEYDDRYDKKIHKLFNSNYFEITSEQESCYYHDFKILDLLYKYKCDVNVKDIKGMTPLMIAIDKKNLELIQKLLDYNVNIRQKNIGGLDSLDYIVRIHEKNLMINMYNVCDDLSKDIFGEFAKKYDNNLPINSNILLKIALHMLNHHFYIISQDYNSKWTFNMWNDFIHKLSLNYDNVVPLLRVVNKIKYSDKNERNIEFLIFQDAVKNNEKNNKKKIKLEKLKTELNEEKIFLEKKVKKSVYDESRIEEIKKKIILLDDEIKNINITTTKNSLTNKFDVNIDPKSINLSDNVVLIYDEIYDKLHNPQKDLTLYSKLWKIYIDDSDKKNDYTMLLEIINKNHSEISNDLLMEFYENNLNPYIRNYLDLPKEYKTINKCLDIIIDIIIHILKKIVLNVLYYEIIGNIEMFLTETFKTSSKDDIHAILIKIIDDKNNESNDAKLKDYIFNFLPVKLVKKTLQIFEGDSDMDDDNETIDNLLLNIVNVLNINTTLNMEQNTILSQNLKTTIIPRQQEYIKIVVETLYRLMNNYLNFVYDNTNDLFIINCISKSLKK